MNQRGFIALISAIIISAILMSLASAGNISGFYARSNILDAELKEQSLHMALACEALAELQLTSNATFEGNVSNTTKQNTCVAIVSVASALNQKQIESFATSSGEAVTHLHTILDSATLEQLSQIEIFR